MSNLEDKDEFFLETDMAEALQNATSLFKTTCSRIYSNPDIDFRNISEDEARAVHEGLVIPVCSLMMSHLHCPFLGEARGINKVEGKNSQFNTLLDFLHWIMEKEESSHRKVMDWSPEHVDRETKESISLERIQELAEGASYFNYISEAFPGFNEFYRLQELFDKVVPASFNLTPSVLNELVPSFILTFAERERSQLWEKVEEKWIRD